MPKLAPAVQPFVDALHKTGRPRVWSMVVTIFGDAVLHRGGRISVQDLQSLTEPMQISEGSLRTAISRLASEGWLIGERVGRNSFYSLSDDAKKQTQAAAHQIYRTPALDPAPSWVLGIGDATLPKGAIKLTKQVSAWTKARNADANHPDLLIIDGKIEQLPDWVSDAIVPNNRTSQIKELCTLLTPLKDFDLPAHDALVLRSLLIHFWRRIALGIPDLAYDLMPKDWIARDCHQYVAHSYQALLAASEQALPDLPVGSHKIEHRLQS
ncbi:MAG: PaaX family transcriptional regulator C-terminal domain-containing protein [Paracoccaceae bacterium]